MKKKILGGMVVLAIATVVLFNVNMGSRANSLSDVSVANIDALALDQFQLYDDFIVEATKAYCCGDIKTCTKTTLGDVVMGNKQYNPCN